MKPNRSTTAPVFRSPASAELHSDGPRPKIATRSAGERTCWNAVVGDTGLLPQPLAGPETPSQMRMATVKAANIAAHPNHVLLCDAFRMCATPLSFKSGARPTETFSGHAPICAKGGAQRPRSMRKNVPVHLYQRRGERLELTSRVK